MERVRGLDGESISFGFWGKWKGLLQFAKIVCDSAKNDFAAVRGGNDLTICDNQFSWKRLAVFVATFSVFFVEIFCGYVEKKCGFVEMSPGLWERFAVYENNSGALLERLTMLCPPSDVLEARRKLFRVEGSAGGRA